MSDFLAKRTEFSGLYLLERKKKGDSRGFLSRIFCSQELSSLGWEKPLAQVNHTYTYLNGTIRGLHFQHPPYAEIKVVTCVRGSIWDVVVDIRKDSESFLKCYSATLSSDNNKALFIPEGFAHGFQALSDDVELIYVHSKGYRREFEDGLNPLDPILNISWPRKITEISERDKNHKYLKDFKGIEI